MGLIVTTRSTAQTELVNGNPIGFPPMSSLPGGGPPFHPNCTKGTRAIILAVADPMLIGTHLRAAQELETARRNNTLLEEVA